MRTPERILVGHDDLPAWAVDNEFIVHGYRATGGINEEIKARKSSNGTGRPSDTTIRTRKALAASTKETEHIELYEHNTIYRCWMSIWLYLHNESVNIHTHFWGALIAVIAVVLHLLSAFGVDIPALYFITHHSIFYSEALAPIKLASMDKSSWFSTLFGSKPIAASLPMRIGSFVTSPAMTVAPWLMPHQRGNDWKDIAGFSTFLLGSITVLTFSATFHTVVCHSKEVGKFCNKLDYVGIVAMIVGSFLPLLHYGFYCHPGLQLFYSTSILSLGSLAVYTTLAHKFSTPEYRPIRTSVFLALGLSALIPVAHILAMYGYEAVSLTMGLHYLVAGGAMYVIGALLYMARIPERLSPGTFDYFGASHQIFHVLILLAAASHYICIRRSYTFWHTVEALDGNAVCNAFESLRQCTAK